MAGGTADDGARWRLIFDSIDQGFCTIEVLFDAQQRPVDYVFLETNRAFVGQTGLADALGRRVRALLPAHEDHWFEIYGRIARSGVAERFEAPAGALGRWYDVHAFRIDAPALHHVAVLFTDSSERKRSEAAAAAAAARSAYLVELSDALRPLADPAELLAEACRRLGEHLGSDRAFYAVLGEDGHHYTVEGSHQARGMTPLPARITLDEYGAALVHELRSGRPLVLPDVAAAPALTPAERARFAALEVAACVGVPLVKDGRWVALLAVNQRVPRAWSTDELALIEDSAERTWAAVERAGAQAALQSSEQRFRLIVETVRDYAILTCDAQGRIVDWLPGAQAVFGWTAEEAVGRDVALTFTPEDVSADQPRAEREAARRDGSAPDKRWHQRRDGRRVYIDGVVSALRDEAGAVLGFIKVGQDVTERHAASQRLEVLVGELQHRTRNLMAVVRAIAARTARESGTLQEFRERFDGRLASLALVQNLLSRLSDGRKVEFDELLRAELAAHAAPAERVALHGPAGVQLRSSSVQTFAMALHELATNSLKYGALAGPAGQLDVGWHVEPAFEGEPPMLHVRWIERGAACAPAVPAGAGGGFGRELIERALPYQLQARTHYEIGPEGVHCTIAVPIAMPGEVED